MPSDNENMIITTIAKQLDSDITLSATNEGICIDTSNNRIGINTLNPSESIDVSGGTIKANNFIINDISLNSKLNEIIDALNSLSSTIDISNIP